jgi:SAM-dependent methyltransferase
MSASAFPDRWAAAPAYEDFIGRWSRQLAPKFVQWLPTPGGAHWLDVGCGTGALTSAICNHANPASVTGCDPSEPFIEFARTHVQDARVSFAVAGAGSLPNRVGGYGCVASSLVLNFIPDPEAAVHEMRSLTSPRGVVSACVWDYADGMEYLRYFWDAVEVVNAAAGSHDEGRRFPICRPEALADLFRAGGLKDVHCEPIEIPTVFKSFEDFWRPLLGGTGSAPSYVASLDADRIELLSKQLERSLPRGPEGRIALTARAWAVRGTAN